MVAHQPAMCNYRQLLPMPNKTAHHFLHGSSDLISLVRISRNHLRNDRAGFPVQTDAFYIYKPELLSLFFPPPSECSGELEADRILHIKFSVTYGKALTHSVSKLCW